MKKYRTPFTHHALDRLAERYCIHLTKRQQLAFARTLLNPKFAISLSDNRKACYFERQWYLVVCRQSSCPQSTVIVIQTFLPLDNANDDDKKLLCHNDQYIKVNDDVFGVLSIPQPKPIELPHKKLVELSSLTDDEVPHDQIHSADLMLRRYCDKDR